MKEIAGYQFPETEEEREAWKEVWGMFPLAQHVLCVAHTRMEGAWTAYCDHVPGDNHDREADAVLAHGEKLPEEIARIMFPQFADLPWAK